MKAEENMSETLNPTKIMIEPSFSSNVASVLFSAITIPRYEIVSFGEELLSTRLTLNISGISLLL